MANLEPVRIEITLRENAAKGLKEIRDASKDVDSGFKRNTGTLKEQVALQKQLIKEIEQDIKNLANAAKGASYGQKNAITGDLAGAKKALAEEQATLLGLQRQQIEGNNKEAESHGGIIAGLGKWVIGLASVAAVMETGKKIIESTESTAHAFEQAIAAVSSATNYLFQSIASGDWSNFTDGMGAAVNGAIEYVNAMEEVNNLANQDKTDSATFDKKIAAAREKTYDKGKDNNAERLKGYDEWIAASEEKYTGLIETAQKRYNALITKASTDTGGKTSVAEIDTFISKYRSVKEMIEEGERYNKLKAVKLVAPMAGGFSPTMGNAAEFDKAQAQMREMGEEGRKAGEQAFKISKIIFTARDAISDAKAKLISLEAQKDLGPTLAKRSKGSLENKIENEAEAAAKKAKEDAELENRIKAVDTLMVKTAERAATASGAQRVALELELEGLAKKLKLLNAEKTLRDFLKSNAEWTQANAKMETKGPTTALGAIGEALGSENTQPNKTTQAKSVIDRFKIDGDAAIARTKKRQEEKGKGTNKSTKEENNNLRDQVQLREDILNAAYELTGSLVEQGLLSEEQGAAIGKTLDGFKSLASGDFVGAAMNIVSQIASLFPTQAEAFQDRIDKINTALDYQRRLIELSDRQGGQEVGRLKEIELLKEKQKADEEALARAESKRSGKIFKIGPVYKGYVKDVKELTAAVLEDKQAVEDATMALGDFYTGGTTEIDISGAIRNGFEDSKSSAEDFAGTFEDFMRTAIDSSLEELSKPEIALWYKKFAADMASGGGLDEKEKVRLKAEWDKIIADNNARRTAAYDVAGIDPTKPEDSATATGMRGDIQRMTEETGSALSGNITAIRINVARLIESGITSMTMVQKSLEYQLRTADNTDVMSKTLGSIDTRLSRLELDGIKVK